MVLCVAMMLSVMVVGAGAAFSDQSKIKNTEAVDACTALNIIGGYPDGSFKPEGNITRAEVTKMICVALNGGKEPNLATNATPTFSDVRTNANSAWAEKYIESCASQGIVSGVGAGKFAPAGNVTGTQLAKMLLVALGYNPDIEKFTGNAWATNVNIIATQKGLYEGLESIDVSAALTRDNAAQMLWNAVKADEVKYEYTLVSENGQLVSKTTLVDKKDGNSTNNLTFLKDKYNVTIVKDAILTKITDDGKGAYNVTTTNNPDTSETEGASYSKVEKDYSELMGQAVDVLVKDGNNSKVFGIYANEDSKVVASGICDDLDTVSGNTEKVKLDSAEYKTDGDLSAVDVYNFNGKSPAGNLNSYMNNPSVAPYSIKLIDNNDDGKIDRAVVVPFTVKKVTYVGSTSLTLENRGSIDKDDAVIAKDLAKDDYVMVIEAANNAADKITLTKVDVVTGTVSSVKDTNTVQINGTWYQKAGSDELTDADLDSTVELQVVNGFYYAADVTGTSSGSSDVLYVSAADAAETKLGDVSASVKAYFTDGSNKEITVVEVNGNDLTTSPQSVVDLSSSVPDTSAYGVGTKSSPNNKIVVGMMYRYETKKNGEYKLYALAATNNSKDKAGYKTYAAADNATYTNKTERLTAGTTSFTIADDAIVFVQAPNATAGDKVKVISGKALKKWNDTRSLYAQVLANDNNGAKNAKVIKLVYTADKSISAATDDSYGYVVETPTRITNSNGDKVWQYVIWNGTKNVTAFEDESNPHAYKGDFVKYNVVSDTEIEDLTNSLSGSYAAVTVVDGKKIDVKLADGNTKSALEIDNEDTNVVYVNTKDTKGVEGGAISEADEPTSGNYTMNVYVVGYANDGDTIDAIFVDVNNKMENDSVTYTATTADPTEVTVDSVKYTLSIPASTKVAEGKSVTVTVTPAAAVTAEAGAKIVVKCNETGKTKTISFAKGDSIAKTATFTQEAYNTTYSIVTSA